MSVVVSGSLSLVFSFIVKYLGFPLSPRECDDVCDDATASLDCFVAETFTILSVKSDMIYRWENLKHGGKGVVTQTQSFQ